MKRIGIFGGSFDPVHFEHIAVAKSAVKDLFLDALYVMPTFRSPHKSGLTATPEDRLNMLKAAFDGCEKIIVSDYEIKKQGVSYSYLTVLDFKKSYPDAKLFFIMGSDMLSSFSEWKNPAVIAENASLVLASREGDGCNDEKAIESAKNLYGAEIFKISYKGADVSSSKIRVYSALGLDISAFTPESVCDYIEKGEFYGGDKYYAFVRSALTEKRLIHTAGVILTAVKLAKILGENTQKAELAALLHDVCKYKTEKDYPQCGLPENCPEDIKHQFLGAYVAETVLKITDPDVLNAIRYHTTGRARMSALEKIIYVADMIEPSRRYAGVDDIRNAVSKDFYSGFKFAAEEVIKFLTEKGSPVYYLTLDAAKYN